MAVESRGWRRWCAVAVVSACALLPAHAQQAVITQLDGAASITEGARRVQAHLGQRLGAGALVDTSAATALLRIEWPGGVVVDLGPDSRAMVAPPRWRARSGHPPALYLLQGWAKVGGASAPAGGIVTPRFELLPVAGASVLFVDTREQQLFAESGPLQLLPRPAGAERRVAAGAFVAGDGETLERPAGAWLQRVPRAFRDPIPRRAAALADRAERPADAPAPSAPSYAELAPWLTAEAALRRDFPVRFAALAQEPSFRRALQQRLSSHPEWAAVLNPPPANAPRP